MLKVLEQNWKCRSMRALTANITHNTLRSGRVFDQNYKHVYKVLKTTNMANLRNRRTGRDRGLSDK